MQHITSIGKKAVVALGVAMLIGSGFAFAPQARATTNDDLEAQIQHLIAIVAQLQAQLAAQQHGGTSCTFTRDLGYGISGTDVTCLQQYLINTGYSIPAGPTGYFGAQTQAAVAVWQAAHSVIPANGYFAATSRVVYQQLLSGTTGGSGSGGSGSDNGGLTGGAASLDSYNLSSESDADNLREDRTNQEVATIHFQVNDGDVRLTEAELRMQATNSDLSVRPWDYFDSITLYDDDNNEKIDTLDASSASDWDKVSDNGDTPVYSIDFKRLDDIIREDDSAHILVKISTVRNIDSSDMDQTFNLSIDNHGLTAEDSTGKDRTTGDLSDRVNLSFNN